MIDKRIQLFRTFRAAALPAVGLCLMALLDAYGDITHLSRAHLDKTVRVGYILLGSALAYRLFCGIVLDMLVAAAKGRPVPGILKHLVGIAVSVVALMGAINVVFTDAFTGVLALSSVIGVVVGLALRPIILDVFSGLSTNLDAAFQIGDWIEFSGRPGSGPVAGWVEEVNWRTTHIRTRSGNLIICPNSAISTSLITNLSRPARLSRFEVPVKLPSEVDAARAERLLQAAVDATVGTENGPTPEIKPDVILVGMKDAGVDYLVRYWLDPAVQSTDAVRHLVVKSMLRHLHLAGIPIAEPVVLNKDSRVIADPASASNRSDVLSKIDLFKGLDHDGITRLADETSTYDFAPGELLIHQGAEDSDMFVIVAGAVEVLVRVDGSEVAVDRMCAGDYFGEMSLLTGEPRTASIRTLTDGTVYRISRDAVAHLIEADAGLMAQLGRNLADRNLNRSKKSEAARENVGEDARKGLAANLLEKMKAVFGRFC